MIRPYAWVCFRYIVLLGLLGGSLGLHAQSAQFSSEADAISGNVTKCLLTILPILCQTTTVGPVDQSLTSVSGANSNNAPSASQDGFGINLYTVTNVADTTRDADTPANDSGSAEAATGTGSLLNELVTWTASDVAVTCTPDPSMAGQVDCSGSPTMSNLTLGGTRVPPGTYPPGTQFPVTGTISDPGCLLGLETFSGVWTVLPSTQSGQGTREVTWTVNNGELTGTATCKTAALVTLFTDQVDLKMGGPSVGVKNLLGTPVGSFLFQSAELINQHL